MLLKMCVKFQALMIREEGQDLVEYAMLIALLALVLISTVRNIGPDMSSIYAYLSTGIAGF
jgi:Flp pilus assembly pilin Flp